ncbi:hypothetical protein IscW_ISCW008447 [Ixodes scapularis]|uniref:Uncharacterized protein n=1 Tax=Ixodes scapularis TaxID=6945 RepID=B7PVQ9_IXOSC|nr:hypothetical protein IscW_ISCW008447 [Ixodes scapularis]|eukprot:XP_002408428.1 hypothetical protein IscW_ISCW008447 [Ixodes scapularis]
MDFRWNISSRMQDKGPAADRRKPLLVACRNAADSRADDRGTCRAANRAGDPKGRRGATTIGLRFILTLRQTRHLGVKWQMRRTYTRVQAGEMACIRL